MILSFILKRSFSKIATIPHYDVYCPNLLLVPERCLFNQHIMILFPGDSFDITRHTYGAMTSSNDWYAIRAAFKSGSDRHGLGISSLDFIRKTFHLNVEPSVALFRGSRLWIRSLMSK
jgi:hypothetical protein